MLGILVVDKPSGITSHDVVDQVRRTFGTRRVGHAGTLDPLATGVLVVAVGPATRFLQYLSLEPKVYECRAKFGEETDTQDAEGEIVRVSEVPADLCMRIPRSMPSLTGEIQQEPPAYSAIKVSGKPLYRYARRGETVEVAKRTVYIHDFEMIDCHGIEASFRISCSGGTYVRTLLHDLGVSVGCGAHVTKLRRIAVGQFDLDHAVPLAELEQKHLISLAKALAPMKMFKVDKLRETQFRNGMAISKNGFEVNRGRVAISDDRGRVFAIAAVREEDLAPLCIIPTEALDD